MQAIGLDVGTSNLVVAKLNGQATETTRLRNAFVEIGEEQKQRLALNSLNAVTLKGGTYIVGDEAISIARILGKDVRRPMAAGVLNPQEKEARTVVTSLIRALVGELPEGGAKVAFSVPSAPIDAPKTNAIWHTGFFTSLLEDLGFEAEAVNEALAIIYSECGGEDDHSGIAISHGAGQVNVCASYKLVGSLEFSIARGGDWIDVNSANSIGESVPNILKVKEDPLFDLLRAKDSENEIEASLYFHYRALIKYELQQLIGQWSKMKGQLDFPAPIPIILSGGTASLKGFKDLWEQELRALEKKTPLPFKVKEVRMASDPLGAVARGLLTYALATL